MSEDTRMEQLEILAAEQEKAIAELSDQIAAQWKIIDAMERKLDALTRRFLELEQHAGPEVPVTKPPHW